MPPFIYMNDVRKYLEPVCSGVACWMPALNNVQTVLSILVAVAVLAWYGLQFYKEFHKDDK